MALGTLFSSVIHITSGYFGGKYDTLAQRFVDAWMSCPPLFLLFMTSILGPGRLNLIWVLGFVLSIKENVFVEGARAIGSSTLRILLLHILPNVMVPTIMLASLLLGAVILIEAVLSFLGYGVPPPFLAWGRMLSTESRIYMVQAACLARWPGVFLSAAVFGRNVFGDALRDPLELRMRGAGLTTVAPGKSSL